MATTNRIPIIFVCPITQLIMREPVIASDGNRYEREAIENWFLNNHKAPVVGIPLANKDVIPDEVLKKRIEIFLSEKQEIISDNEVYLPKKYLDCMQQSINEKNIDQINGLSAFDVRLLTFSGQQAIRESGTVYKDPNQASDRSGFHLACEVANSDIIFQMLNTLELNSISLDFIDKEKPKDWSPIALNESLRITIEKGDIKSCKILIKIGADVNYENGQLLHRAVTKKHKDIVELLLKHNVDVDALGYNFDWKTPLHLAVEIGDIEIIKILLDKKPNTEIKAHRPLLPGLSSDWTRSYEQLYEKKANITESGTLPLHIAARNGNKDIVKLLLKCANIEGKDNAGDHKGNTPLIWASCNGHLDIVKLLIESGADVENTDNAGWTALHWAANGGQLEVIKLLMDYGADHKACNNKGETPVQVSKISAQSKSSNLEVVNRLKTIPILISNYHRKLQCQAIKNTKILEEKFNTAKNFFQAAKKVENGKVTFEFDKQKFDDFEEKNCSLQ
jgi:ankyrin repeat protein